MSLLATKPSWFQNAVATDYGWVNPNTGELLVSHRQLKTKLDREQQIIIDTPVLSEQLFISEEPIQTAELISEVIDTALPIDESIKIDGVLVTESKKSIKRKKV